MAFDYFIKDYLIPGISAIGTVGVFGYSAYVFHKHNNLEKAKWLLNLWEKFFYEKKYSKIRQLFDSPNKFGELVKITSDKEHNLEEDFVDYLNFFQFIASLRKSDQLEITEIKMMFDYYLSLIGERECVMDYLKKNKFDELHDLVEEIKKLNLTNDRL